MRWLAVPVVAAVVVVGLWLTGGVLTDDYTLAMVLTAVFLTAGGALALGLAWRWRRLIVPVLGTYVVVAGSLGGYLLVTSHRDVVVDEQLVTVDEPMPAASASGAPRPAASARATPAATPATPAAVVVRRGSFTSDEHRTTGRAALVRLGSGGHVLTLDDLATSPGPDLRVYLVPGDGTSARGHLDLGALKGNKGDQQYLLPAGTDASRYTGVIIWCRAFTVAFGHAALS